MTKALEFNPVIVSITPLLIKPSVLLTTMLEVKPAKVESMRLIVSSDVPLIVPFANNASVVAAPQ